MQRAFAELCAARGIAFVDGIFAISGDAARDPALVASDGLHPSAAQYRRWVSERIEPAVRRLLASAEPGRQRSGVSQTGYSVMFSGLPSLAERS